MGELLKIGQMARAAGCTVKAVRFYEVKGLLPKPARGPSGYRLYTEQAVKRLQFIRRAKLIGLPLAKIGELVPHLSEAGCACATVRPHFDRLVRAQLAETEAKLAQLALLKEELEGLLPKMGRAQRSVPQELCVCAGTKGEGSERVILLDPPKREAARRRSPVGPGGAPRTRQTPALRS